MNPATRSVSFDFHTGDPSASKENAGLTRRCLETKYDKENASCSPMPAPRAKEFKGPLSVAKSWRSNFSLASLSVSSQQTGRRVLKSGTEKLSRTFSNVRISIDEFSQKLRRTTRRRYRMSNESPKSPKTPGTRARRLLGRTPTKMYSPFSIDTPRQKRLATYTPRNNRGLPGCSGDGGMPRFHSPRNAFAADVAATRDGIAELDRASRSIVRRSLRH